LKSVYHIIQPGLVAIGICVLLLCASTVASAQEVEPDSTHQELEVNPKKKSKKSRGKQTNKTEESEKSKVYRAMYIGVLGGAGYYDVFFNPSFQTTGDISTVFGASFRYESPLNKSIEVELRYRKSGWQNKDIYSRELGIIEMPVIAHVSFGKKKTKPFFTLGETVTVIAYEKEEIIDQSVDPVFSGVPINNKVGFSLNLGLGVIRYLEKGAIQLEVRGTVALTNQFKPDNELMIENSNAYFIEGVIKYLFQVK